MLRNLNKSSGGRRILGVSTVGILTSQIIAETATGDNGPGLLYDEALVNSGKQLRVKVTSYSGTPGKLFVFENGSLLLDGESDGAYTISYDVLVDNVITGSDTATITVGNVDAYASGAALAGSSSISAGAASGTAAGTAAGANLSGASSISGGAASGQQNSAAPGATLVGSGSISPGAASGTGAGTAAGANLSGTSLLTPGAANGQQNATAPGASLSGVSNLQAGSASGSTAATVARPITDAANSGWVASSGSDLYAMLDEITPNDADYIAASAVGATCQLGLGPVADPGTSSGQQISYRANSPSGHGITVRLMQGAVQIASWSHANLPADPTSFTQTLSAGQCDAITDYSALSVEMIAI